MQIGGLGVIFVLDALSASETAQFARHVENLGYRTLWLPEGEGREPFSHAAYLLSRTEMLNVATGIANVWVRDPIATRAGAATLAELSGGRFLLGLGVGHAPLMARRGHAYDKPFSYMREYLGRIGEAPYNAPRPPGEVPIVLAALRPRMLELAAREAHGALVAFVPAEFTAKTRIAIGESPWLCVDMLVILETDASRARAVARARLRPYIPALPNYTETLRTLGWNDSDFADGCSDRLVDAIVAWGDEERIRERIAAHFRAGATHVCIAPLRSDGSRFPDERAIEALAPARTEPPLA